MATHLLAKDGHLVVSSGHLVYIDDATDPADCDCCGSAPIACDDCPSPGGPPFVTVTIGGYSGGTCGAGCASLAGTYVLNWTGGPNGTEGLCYYEYIFPGGGPCGAHRIVCRLYHFASGSFAQVIVGVYFSSLDTPNNAISTIVSGTPPIECSGTITGLAYNSDISSPPCSAALATGSVVL